MKTRLSRLEFSIATMADLRFLYKAWDRHVNTSMIYKTYGRYIPNLTRKDGSALEGLLAGAKNEQQPG